jgi:hypothetical protein
VGSGGGGGRGGVALSLDLVHQDLQALAHDLGRLVKDLGYSVLHLLGYTEPGHKVVTVTTPGWLQTPWGEGRRQVELDNRIAPVVMALWRARVPTYFSCQGDARKLAYVDVLPAAAPAICGVLRRAGVRVVTTSWTPGDQRFAATRISFDIAASYAVAGVLDEAERATQSTTMQDRLPKAQFRIPAPEPEQPESATS